MTVSKIASVIYQEAKKACKEVWNWRFEWSKAMKKAWRKVMNKKSVIERMEEKGNKKIKGVRMAVEHQAKELNQLSDLELLGSTKQISWAKDILATFLVQAGQEIEGAIIRTEEGGMPKEWAYTMLDSALEISRAVSNNAGEIISNRSRLTGSMVSQMAQRKYNA